MGELVKQTLEDLMQMGAEQIALNQDPFNVIYVWAEISNEYGVI